MSLSTRAAAPTLPRFHAPNLARRLALATFGLVIFSIGMVLNLQANVGLGPWPAFSYGATRYLPITFGQANLLIGLGMIGASFLLGVRPGLATAMNVLMTWIVPDALLAAQIVPTMSGGIDGYLMLMIGVIVIGLGTAIYVKAELGAGPRDGFMLGLAARLGGRVGPARMVMDAGATLCGWLLGAQIGPGTVLFVLTQGSAVAFWFRILRVRLKRTAVRASAKNPATAASRTPV